GRHDVHQGASEGPEDFAAGRKYSHFMRCAGHAKMKPLLIIAMTAFAVLPVAGSAIADEPLPRGSYLGSCDQEKVVNDVLYARCESDCSDSGCRLNNTHLNHVSRCIGDVGNAYGRLTCSRWNTAPASTTATAPTQESVDAAIKIQTEKCMKLCPGC